jgi:hypothetical protein
VTLAPPLHDASILRQLAALEPGWHTAPDCAWALAGESYDARGDILRLLGALYKEGELQRLHVWQKDRPIACYFLDSQRLLALAEEAES